MAIPVNKLWPKISQAQYLFAQRIIRRAVKRTLGSAAISQNEKPARLLGSVGVSLVGPAEIKRLNRSYRHKNKVTDVLSFPLGEPKILGDVIICWPVAVRQAKQLGHGLKFELAWLAVHGTLHLLGWDHLTAAERKKMEAQSAQILAALKV